MVKFWTTHIKVGVQFLAICNKLHFIFCISGSRWKAGTSFFFPLGFLALLLLLWLLLAQFGDVDLLLALHHRFGQQLEHVVQMGVDLMTFGTKIFVV